MYLISLKIDGTVNEKLARFVADRRIVADRAVVGWTGHIVDNLVVAAVVEQRGRIADTLVAVAVVVAAVGFEHRIGSAHC